MTPIEMHYSWVGLVYGHTAGIARFLGEKSFDVLLALLGTVLGYLLAKRHLEHFVTEIAEKMDSKYLNLNSQMAFRRAVAEMLPELPQFYMRPTGAFSSKVAVALGDYTSWATAIDPSHTPEKSMELVGTEAYKAAAGLIQKDLGFREAVPIPDYEWEVGVDKLPVGWTVEEPADLTIFNWDTGVAMYRHATMKEAGRTAPQFDIAGCGI
jgi:hypothetical protein